MKRLLFIFLSLFIFTIVHANDIYEVTATRLNVRTAPHPNASVVGGLAKGELVEVLEIKNKTWASFLFRNRTCYASVKFLKFVKHVSEEVNGSAIAEEVMTEDTVTTVEEEQPVSKLSEIISFDNLPTLLNGPVAISKNFELYYGIGLGAGYSTFLWNGNSANGTIAYTVDVFAELDFNKKVWLIPNGYFSEFQFGYDSKGATWYSLNYIHARIYPFGYKLNISPVKLGFKAGLYLGCPLSDLESYSSSRNWKGNFQVGVTGGAGVDYKQFSLYANVEYNFTGVASAVPVTLKNIAIFGTLSYKFGKLKH